jgi:hypothetical protein
MLALLVPRAKLHVKAGKVLPLVGLARSKQDPVTCGCGAQYLYRPPPAGVKIIIDSIPICLYSISFTGTSGWPGLTMVALSFACKQCKSQVSCAQQNASHELIVFLIVLHVQH